MKPITTPDYARIQSEPGSFSGIGIDLVEVERIRRAVERFGKNFLQKIFSPQELADSHRHADPYPSLAARFAAKEATAKAFGTGIGPDFSWQSAIAILDEQGRPELWLDSMGQKRARALGVRRVELSLTHTRTLAQAVVILGT